MHSFMRHLNYCNLLLYWLHSSLISKLQCVQNSATILAYRTPTTCHITPLLTELHWLNIKHSINFKIILITYKAIHAAAPPYIISVVSHFTQTEF